METVQAIDPVNRLVALNGAVNFRDFGGYRSADGRAIRWGRLYRADSLAELTAADVEILAALGLRTICDLRHEDERRHKPDHADVVAGVKLHGLGFLPNGAQEMFDGIRAGRLAASEVEAHLNLAYARFPIDQAQVYARILQLLIEGDALPLLVHCTSGKDRTGFAVATILMALGVPRATILEDYLLTNQYRRNLSFMLGERTDAAVMEVITRAHSSYLEASWQTIDQHWGSDQAFVRDGLGFDDASVRVLRERLLQAD